MITWRRVEDTETGAQYSVTTEQQGSTWRELPDELAADAQGRPLPTKTRAQLDAERVAAAVDEGALFDPGTAHVKDVLIYLEGVDDTERERVIAAEAAGQNRTTITGWAPTA